MAKTRHPRHTLPSPEELHHRAREALVQGRFDLAEEALSRDELDIEGLIEDLRIYQAELEIQNHELQESRACLEHALGRFTAFFATLPLAELIVDDKGLILEANQAAAQLFELARDHLRQHFFVRLVAESDRGAVIDTFASAQQAQRADLIEIGLRTVIGRPFTGDLHIASLPAEVGQERQYVCAVVDRTDAVHQREVLRETAEGLRRGRAELAERVKQQSCLYDIVKLKLKHDVPTAVVLQQVVERLPAAMGEPELVGVCIRLPDQDYSSAGFHPAEGMVDVPFALHGGEEARLQVAYRESSSSAGAHWPALRAQERSLCEAVAGHLESFLRRRAIESELEQSRESYRILAEYSPEWEYWLGSDGRYLYVSPACEAITGYPAKAFQDDPGLTARLIHPEDQERYLAHREQVLAPGLGARHRDAERLELRLRTRAGEGIWIDHICAPVVSPDGRWRGRRGVNRDITARKRAEAGLMRMSRLYGTLCATSQAIVRHASEEGLLGELCRIAVDRGGLAACTVHRRQAGIWPPEPVAATYAAPAPSQRDPRGVPMAAAPWGEGVSPAHGLCFPLVVGGELVGCKTVYATEPDFFADDIVALLAEMADDLAFALDRFRKDEARATAERVLQAREQELGAIFRSANIGIGLVQDRKIRQANDYWFGLVGYRPAELLDRSTRVLYSDDAEYERVGRELYRAVARSGAGIVESQLRHKHGHRIDVLVGVALLDPANRHGPVVFSALDVTERKQAERELEHSGRRLEQSERALRESEERLRLTMAATTDALCDWDVPSRRWLVNPRFFEMLGYQPGELEPTFDLVTSWLHPEDRAPVVGQLEQCLDGGEPFALEGRLRRKDGGWLWVQARGQVVDREPSGQARRVVGTLTDITARKEAEGKLMESNRRLRQAARVFENTADGVLITDPEQRILAVNRAFTEISGYAESDVVGHTPEVLQSGRHGDAASFRSIWGILSQTESWRGELWSRRKDGELYRMRMTVSTVRDPDGADLNYVIVISDITSLTQTRDELQFLMHHDALTRLPNRTLFRSRLEHGLQRAARDRRAIAVMLLDLDRFRVINESLGPTSGDLFLRLIGGCLAGALRPGDTVARLSGDEFGFILEDLGGPHDAAEIAQRLLQRCAAPQRVAGQEIVVTGCVGVGIYPNDGEDVESLLRHADVALKKAKERGPHVFEFFEAAMELDVLERLGIESALRRSLELDELELHYQPQVVLADGRLIGAEVLLRWQSAELGRVPPGRFIPLAEEMGLINGIGAWALQRACEQLVAWDSEGRRLPRLAVNVSIRQLELGDLVAQLDRILRCTGADPTRLELEITESMVMRRIDLALPVLKELRSLGVRLAIDDFGTGYSSLAYLWRLPVHQLKIDKSFVDSIASDPNSVAVARAVIALGHSLDLEVLAEGVEDADQAALLCREGCDLAQGYYFERPLPAADFAARWLA